MTTFKHAFDEVSWSASDADHDGLSLPGLAAFAAEAGLALPQLAVATALSSGEDPLGHLETRGVGITDIRRTAWGGLIRALHHGAPYVVQCWVLADGVAVFVGATPYTDTRWRRVEQSWLRSAAPSFIGASLAGGAFLDTARALTDVGIVHVSRLAAVVDEDQSSYTRGWREGGQTLAGALDEISDNMTVRKLQLVIGDGRLSLHLRRNGGASYYSGDWSIFAEHVLERLVAAAKTRREILSKPRRNEHELPRDAITMSLGGHRLASVSTRTELIESLRSLRGVGLAVLHRNPYLHVLISDHLDGSSFDLFVTDDQELQLVPGPYATASALGRVADAIASDLGIRDLEAVAVPGQISEADYLAQS